MEKKLNILFILETPNPHRGGVAMTTFNLSRALRSRGHIISYAYLSHMHDFKPDINTFPFVEYSPFEELKKVFYPQIEKRHIDLIIDQDETGSNMSELFNAIRKDFGIPVIYCSHTLPDHDRYWKLGWYYKLTEFLYLLRNGHYSSAERYIDMYQSVDRYILLSESFIKIAERFYSLEDSSKLRVIPNSIEPIEKESIIPFDQKPKQFLIISRLAEHPKNIKAALRIWKEFERQNDEYSLVLAGYGPDEKDIVDYAQSLGLKRFNFIGKTSNPAELYNRSRYFMMTSICEGFGLTLIEAQQYGCIPFAFDSYASLHDIINDKFNGFIIENGNEKKYLQSMLNATNNPTIANISNNAIESVSKFYSSSIADRWEQLFAEFIKK